MLAGLTALVAAALERVFLAASVGVVALSLGAAAAWAPEAALRALERGVDRVAEWVGVGLSWLLLAPIFWLFVVPLGVLTRRGARDPLGRRGGAATYWRPRSEETGDTSRPY